MITITYTIERVDGTRERIVSIQPGEGGIVDRAIRLIVGPSDKLTVHTKYEADVTQGISPEILILDDYSALEERVIRQLRGMDRLAEEIARPVLRMVPIGRPYGKSYRRRGPYRG